MGNNCAKYEHHLSTNTREVCVMYRKAAFYLRDPDLRLQSHIDDVIYTP